MNRWILVVLVALFGIFMFRIDSRLDVIQSQVEDLNRIVKTGEIVSYSPSELECLAKNIYYEAGLESEEGKVAVGLVTINRSNSGDFPQTICGVVNQRTVYSVPHTVTKTHTVTEGRIFKKTYQVKETVTVWTNHSICQFSWRCEHVHQIRKNDARWTASLAVAEELLNGGYYEFRD